MPTKKLPTTNTKKGFWDKLPKPFFILAPMYDVTDMAFRQIITECGKPDVFFTEFVSADGLCHEEGKKRLMHHLKFDDSQKPIVAQIFGKDPDKFYKTAKLITELGFDGIDINMGCPDKNMVKQGSCAALFRNPKLAKEILLATKDGAGNLPVSVKIRIGDTKVDWQEWIKQLLEASPATISIHLRTRKEMSKVPAHWEEMPKIVRFIRENTEKENLPYIVGNGDVVTLEEGEKKIQETGCDGIMIGRGVFQNPWLFQKTGKNPTTQEKLLLLKKHALLFEKYFSQIKSFAVFKRFIKIYCQGFDGAGDLREKLYAQETAEDISKLINEFLSV